MSGWNIDYNKFTAETVRDAVSRGKHLKGFGTAEERLGALKTMLENVRFDADWYREKCESEARHYEAEQKNLQANPQNFTPDHARAAMSKSPQVFDGIAEKLKAGANALHESIAAVDGILKKLEYARDDAEQSSKRIADRVSRAIELMDNYMRVEF